jgi:hypothetical protein
MQVDYAAQKFTWSDWEITADEILDRDINTDLLATEHHR